MKAGKFFMFFAVITFIGAVAIVGALTDARERISESYPSAEVAVYEGHSPGIDPVLSMIRLLRGKRFVPPTAWVSVQLTDESKPVDFAALLQLRVIAIKLTRCKVNDLSALIRRTPSAYVELISCDLNAVPLEQKAVLQSSPDNPERYTYGGP